MLINLRLAPVKGNEQQRNDTLMHESEKRIFFSDKRTLQPRTKGEQKNAHLSPDFEKFLEFISSSAGIVLKPRISDIF